MINFASCSVDSGLTRDISDGKLDIGCNRKTLTGSEERKAVTDEELFLLTLQPSPRATVLQAEDYMRHTGTENAYHKPTD